MSGITDWLDQAQARADAATDGPWDVEHGRIWANSDVFAFNNQIASMSGSRPWMSDADFIAAARTDLPAAIAALRAVLARCDKADANPRGGSRWVHTAVLRQALTEALGVEP